MFVNGPSTSLSFDQNLQALAFATAKEGCIDETLSALIRAGELMELNGSSSNSRPSLLRVLKEKLTTISRDEARHAALAWRTIRWICEENVELCTEVNNYIKMEWLNRTMLRLKSCGLKEVTKNIIIVELRNLFKLLESFVMKDVLSGEKSPVIPKDLNFIEEISQDIQHLTIFHSSMIVHEESE